MPTQTKVVGSGSTAASSQGASVVWLLTTSLQSETPTSDPGFPSYGCVLVAKLFDISELQGITPHIL